MCLGVTWKVSSFLEGFCLQGLWWTPELRFCQFLVLLFQGARTILGRVGTWQASFLSVFFSFTLIEQMCVWPQLCVKGGEDNGNPLQYCCLENPMNGGAWWAAVHGVAKSWTRLKRLSGSSSSVCKAVCWGPGMEEAEVTKSNQRWFPSSLYLWRRRLGSVPASDIRAGYYANERLLLMCADKLYGAVEPKASHMERSPKYLLDKWKQHS